MNLNDQSSDKTGNHTLSNRILNVDPLDFSPALLRVQSQPAAPLARSMLYLLLGMISCLLLWASFAQLDVVAVAEGKLLPQSYLKIVQPADAGVIREILVHEGEAVKAGQVLMRLDATLSQADDTSIQYNFQQKYLSLRRIDAELAGQPFVTQKQDDPQLYQQMLAQYQANRLALQNALAQEHSASDKARSDLSAAQTNLQKLQQTLPHYQQQASAYGTLVQDGYVSQLETNEKQRVLIEQQQDLKAQQHIIASAQSTLAQSQQRITQISADYRQKLQSERHQISLELDKARAERTKQNYRNTLLELKAPQDGVVKDLATHTSGTVISAGTVLMSLVPQHEQLCAEVWISNQDVGFVHAGDATKLKLATYQFQKYGMLDGEIRHLSADASEQQDQQSSANENKPPFTYRALIDLKQQYLSIDQQQYKLTPGMLVTAEIKLGTRSMMEYLLSPVMGVFQEAARER